MKKGFTSLALAFVAFGAALTGCNNDDDGSSLPPPIPGGVYSVTGDGFVDVYWTPVRGVDDLAGYGVYRGAAPEGPYTKLAVIGAAADTYRDGTVVNGATYYFAVDAFDLEGNESALSVEEVFDTPRPAGAALRVYTRQEDLDRSGVDFSEQPDAAEMRVPWDLGDIYVEADADGFFRVIGTTAEDDLQDLGWTSSFDDVGYAPGDGWVSSPVGLELVLHHTYVLWTGDDYYAKFRVTAIEPAAVVIEWAYQADQGNPELARPGVTS